ncbi:LacI family DNA-binding transcriptional regulator [Microlunatus soli]|uniref:DNA-binding transcriptional regulator, LacI/PurR family n=1 Tax=Microlunatus soli TaxID=630515 RepID=A0A1H1ZC39_9ACTN|nr:LacI family DNA-binding transcriptional regulator [Microlunatus soli]SDT31240.1 DNA-binding transcriptional regulator, LacI/PurR family [Microlunatus soli]
MRRDRPHRVSQADVARAAKVSAGIVSSVINDRDYGSIRVSDATRERVWAAVRELGYVPNLAARSLARGSNRLIGVFTYQPVFPSTSRDFYHDFLMGVEDAAEEAAYNLLLVTGARTPSGDRSIFAGGVNNLQLADGAVLLGAGESRDELARMAAENYPFVYIGQRRPEGVELSFVAADYHGGTAAIVRRLAELGHRRIAMIQEAGAGEPVPGRRPGFLAGCREAGIDDADRPLLTLARDNVADDVGKVEDLDALIALAARESITAMVVERTDTAMAVRAAALRAGRSVPGDLSILTLTVPPEPADDPGLAHLMIPRREMGREAVRILLELLSATDSGPIRTTLACGFDPGDTVAPPT